MLGRARSVRAVRAVIIRVRAGGDSEAVRLAAIQGHILGATAIRHDRVARMDDVRGRRRRRRTGIIALCVPEAVVVVAVVDALVAVRRSGPPQRDGPAEQLQVPEE